MRRIKYLLEGNGGQKRSGKKPRNAGRRRRKSRRRRLHQPRGVEEKEEGESTQIHSVLGTKSLGSLGRVTNKRAASFATWRIGDEVETKHHRLWAEPH